MKGKVGLDPPYMRPLRFPHGEFKQQEDSADAADHPQASAWSPSRPVNPFAGLISHRSAHKPRAASNLFD